MPKRVRIIVALCIVAGLVSLATAKWWVADSPRAVSTNTTSPRQGTVEMSNADCRQCHQGVWDEWQASMHAVAWTSPSVRAAFQHFGHDRKCESCHAPSPVFVTGLANPVEFRKQDHERGVDCISCHLTADGRVAARKTNDEAPCRPIASAELQSSRQCAGCHVAIHDDWQQSSFAAAGKTCQSCHMPAVAERTGGTSHVYLGGHDDRTVRSAARLACEVEGDELVVTVENHGAGHNFPGERHNRVLLIEVFEYSSDREIVLGRQRVIKDITPFRGESSTEEIRAGSTSVTRFPVVEGAHSGEVRLLYKRFPWI
ncbi:MAG: multiheme c-type cytochrome, partial [Betaproteobacteria bacterium]